MFASELRCGSYGPYGGLQPGDEWAEAIRPPLREAKGDDLAPAIAVSIDNQARAIEVPPGVHDPPTLAFAVNEWCARSPTQQGSGAAPPPHAVRESYY